MYRTSPRTFVPRALIVMAPSDQAGLGWSLEEHGSGRWRIGCGSDADIRHPSFDARHAEIVCNDEGGLDIVDLGSAGRTFVNGQRLVRCPLVVGAEVQLGPLTLVASETALRGRRGGHLAKRVCLPVIDPAPAGWLSLLRLGRQTARVLAFARDRVIPFELVEGELAAVRGDGAVLSVAAMEALLELDARRDVKLVVESCGGRVGETIDFIRLEFEVAMEDWRRRQDGLPPLTLPPQHRR